MLRRKLEGKKKTRVQEVINRDFPALQGGIPDFGGSRILEIGVIWWM